MSGVQHELQTELYFSALDPSRLPLHLQKRRAQLLLEQLPFLGRLARWYKREGIAIPPDYTIFRYHLQRPATWDHFTQCPLAQEGVQLATWKTKEMITQHAG